MFGLPKGVELIIILAVVLLIFGKRLPEMARSLGKGIVEFKKGLKGVKEDLDDVDADAAQDKPRLDSPSVTNVSKVTDAPGARVAERADHPA